MSEMVERLAKAMYESHGYKRPWGHAETQRLWHAPMLREAQVAIEAMREPTKNMLMASGLAKTQQGKWQAMVDEALR